VKGEVVSIVGYRKELKSEERSESSAINEGGFHLRSFPALKVAVF